jgi:hypothetical protein
VSILARIRDFFHELEIGRLYNAHIAASRRLNSTAAERRATWIDFQRAVYSRSHEAVLRFHKRTSGTG